MQDGLLTYGQAADYLSVKPETLRTWVSRRQQVPFIKLGRLVRFRKEDLDRMIEKSRNEPAKGGY